MISSSPYSMALAPFGSRARRMNITSPCAPNRVTVFIWSSPYLLSDVSSIIDVIYALVRLATAARAPICMHRVRIQVSVTCDNGARAAAEAIAGVSRAYPSQVGAIDTCMTHRFCEMHVGLVAGQGYGR